jgi:hypothetical protein
MTRKYFYLNILQASQQNKFHLNDFLLDKELKKFCEKIYSQKSLTLQELKKHVEEFCKNEMTLP